MDSGAGRPKSGWYFPGHERKRSGLAAPHQLRGIFGVQGFMHWSPEGNMVRGLAFMGLATVVYYKVFRNVLESVID